MRGVKTPPEIVEQVKAVYVRTNSFAESGRLTGVPHNTIYEIVNNDDKFEEFRQQAQKEYTARTWENILALEELLVKKIQSTKLSLITVKEITGSLKDLKQTVENVVNFTYNNINNVQVNNNQVMDDAKAWIQANKELVRSWIEE